jgi:hypothetical protein
MGAGTEMAYCARKRPELELEKAGKTGLIPD